MKRMCLLLLLALLLLTCGCQKEPAVIETTVPPTTVPTVDIGGTRLEYGVTELDLTAMAYDLDMLIDAGQELTAVTDIRLG